MGNYTFQYTWSLGLSPKVSEHWICLARINNRDITYLELQPDIWTMPNGVQVFDTVNPKAWHGSRVSLRNNAATALKAFGYTRVRDTNYTFRCSGDSSRIILGAHASTWMFRNPEWITMYWYLTDPKRLGLPRTLVTQCLATGFSAPMVGGTIRSTGTYGTPWSGMDPVSQKQFMLLMRMIDRGLPLGKVLPKLEKESYPSYIMRGLPVWPQGLPWVQVDYRNQGAVAKLKQEYADMCTQIDDVIKQNNFE